MAMGEKAAVEVAAQDCGSNEAGVVSVALPKQNYLLRMDFRLIPVLGCTYTVLFLDRTNIANARIEGLEKGLNMPSNGYNTALWIFFIPFILIEVPSNLIMGLPRVRPNIFLGVNMFLLGIVATCQGLTQSYGGLLALRFLMGIFEATLPAGAAFLINEYYTRAQMSLRFACFFCFGTLGPCISGILAYGIRNMHGIAGLEGFRWIFIVEGLGTILISAFVFAFVPDFPERTKILSTTEREHLLAVLQQDKGDQKLDLRKVEWARTLTDYKIWFPTMIFFCCDMTAASISSFTPTILTELGWTAAKSQAMSVPVWLTGMLFQVTGAFLSCRTGWRFPFILFGVLCATCGWAIQIAYSEQGNVSAAVRYFSLFCMSGGTFLQMTMSTAWMSNNLRGRASVAVGTAIVLGFGNCANFVATNVFIKAQAPYYPTAFRTGLVITVAGGGFCLIYAGLLWRHNQKLARERRQDGGEDDQRKYMYQL
ncbi:major facilitator superfamily domain-containing protein [Boeremia exigua]|uniref:major facilitator superfamily domain-containing protein n=1 Tax=Boeremia exigua TaxID=749465 RepID=UPI001E8D24FF|nr:major facilitator superfamily domain-containing protein [Boeremia exigua]KAH6625344.1 major facilitator superfamily domain-containing protein [Boeremia exigua]